jgi:hypothetical protein
MARFKFTTTKNGKCDVILTFFNDTNSIIAQRSITFDVKPTIKELLERFKEYKKDGAKLMRITTMPGGMTKFYKL